MSHSDARPDGGFRQRACSACGLRRLLHAVHEADAGAYEGQKVRAVACGRPGRSTARWEMPVTDSDSRTSSRYRRSAADIADLVTFLFFSAWRVGEARTLQWRDYDRADRVLRLRPEHSKNGHGRVLPVEGKLAIIIERRLAVRRLDCPYIFHRKGRRIRDFRKLWAKACTAMGLSGRIVHDLRRSGVKHLINAGNDPHTVMAFSGHRTPSMLRRYHIIDLQDLRRAAQRGASYQGEASTVTPLRAVDGEPT
jgi:integrase